MIEIIQHVNFILALSGVAVLLGSGILIFDLYKERALEQIISAWGLLIAFIITLGASAMTLLYSEVFGFIPCGLCWLQRIFLYPQVFILGTAIYYSEKTAARYGIALSVPGFIIALYQHYLQMGGSELITCPTAGEGADCAKRFLFEFGFMTFPLLSAILFLFLIVLYVYILKTRTQNEAGEYIVTRVSQTIIQSD